MAIVLRLLEALEGYMEDMEDIYLGLQILENPGRIYSSNKEVRAMCGLDDKYNL